MAPGSRRRALPIITVLCVILSVLHQIESKEVKVFKRGKVTLVDETQFENNVDYNFEQDEDDNAPADLDNLYDEKIAALPRFILHKKGEDVGLVRVPIVTRRGGNTWSTPRPKTVKGDYHTWNTDPVLPVTKAPKVTKPPKVPKKEEGLFALPPLKSSEEKKLVVPKLNAEKPNSKSTEKPNSKSTEKSSEKTKSTEKPKSAEKSAEKSSKSTEKSKSIEKVEKAIEKLKATVKPKSSEKSKSTEKSSEKTKSTEKSSSAESTTSKPFSKTSPRVTPTTTKPFSKTSPHVTPTTTKKVKSTTESSKSTSEETEGTTSVTTKKPKKTTTAKATTTSKSSEATSASKETTDQPSTTVKTTKKKLTTTPTTTTTTTEAATTATKAKFTQSRFTTTTTTEPTTTTTTQKPTTKTAAPFVPFAARRNFFTPESTTTTTTTTQKSTTTTTQKPTTTTTTLKPTTTTRLAPSVFPTTIRRNFFTFISTSTQQPTTTTTRAPAPRWTPFQTVNRVPPVPSPSVSPFIVNRQPAAATVPPPPRTLPPWARSQTFAPAVLPREEPRRIFTPQTTQQRLFTPQFQQRPFRPRFQIQAERPRPNNALKTPLETSKTSNDSSTDQWKLTNQLSAANEALEVDVDSKERNQVNVHFVKFARRYGSQRIIPASATTPPTVHIVTHFTPGPSMVQQVKSNQLFIQNQNTGSRPNNFFLPQSVTTHPRPFVNQQVFTTTITPQRFQNRVGTNWSSWSAWGSTDPRTAKAFTRTRGQFVQPSATTPAPIQATTTIAFSPSHVASVTSSPIPKPPVIQHPDTRYRGPTYNCRILMANEDGRPSPRNDYSCRMKYPGFPADSQCRCTYEVAGRDVHGCATGFLYTCHRI